MIRANCDLCEKIVELKADSGRLTADRTDALKKLEASVDIKEETEKNLYAKFTVVLNDKKAKLRHLKSQLEASEVSATGVVDADKQEKRAAEIRAVLAEQDKSETTPVSSKTDTDTEVQDTQPPVSVSSKVGSKKPNDKTSHVLDFMLEEPETGADDDIPAGPKRSKVSIRSDRQQASDKDKTSNYCGSVPRMLSTTGTTDTQTTSSDRQRYNDKPDKSSKGKDSKKSEQSKPSRSADIDDLIDDMA